jgi:putative thioredoxin
MSAYALDVGLADFAQQVIEESRQRPVVVDFWAPWCGPCRTLKPVLEKLADEFGGKFLLAKVNADENQALSGRYGVRGIPAVKAFVGGQVVDEFSGALPEGAVREWLQKLMPSPADALRVRAQQLFADGDPATALNLLAQASQLDPKNENVRIDAAEILLAQGEQDETRRLLDSLGPDSLRDDRVMQLRARINLAAGPDTDEQILLDRIARNAHDLAAWLDLARAHLARHDYARGMDALLEIIRRDRNYQDDIARKTLLDVFNLLAGQPLVSEYRRKLASALN